MKSIKIVLMYLHLNQQIKLKITDLRFCEKKSLSFVAKLPGHGENKLENCIKN